MNVVELRNAMNEIELLREHQIRKVLVGAEISQPLGGYTSSDNLG
ncbi:hypothetical protein [Mesorhizobium sp. CO1-1-7]|nr:hypothetical protein [Mesorhizobium sp. CO1-1-7]